MTFLFQIILSNSCFLPLFSMKRRFLSLIYIYTETSKITNFFNSITIKKCFILSTTHRYYRFGDDDRMRRFLDRPEWFTRRPTLPIVNTK